MVMVRVGDDIFGVEEMEEKDGSARKEPSLPPTAHHTAQAYTRQSPDPHKTPDCTHACHHADKPPQRTRTARVSHDTQTAAQPATADAPREEGTAGTPRDEG